MVDVIFVCVCFLQADMDSSHTRTTALLLFSHMIFRFRVFHPISAK